ncbi:MAG: terminase small subunit [Youngiibacter sp.]|nr:terminase small subunit [Youngiibacter sp.]
MAKAPDARMDEARSLYLGGMALKDIAERLGVPEGTVRSWKKRQDWDGNGKTQRNDQKRNATQKKTATQRNIPPAVRSVMENKDLSDKEREFCLLFSKSFNATKSYMKAFGVEYRTAQSNGYRLLTYDYIKAEIDRLKEERYSRAYLKEPDIFQRYMDIAFSDIGDYVWFGREMVPVMGAFGPLMESMPDGSTRPLMKEINSVRFREAAEVDTSVLAEVKQGKDGSSIKLMDRMRALDWLADHIGMATEKQKMELDKLRLDIEREKGNEEELSKLDMLLEAMDDEALR